MWGFGLPMLLLFVAGVPCAFFVLLYRNQHRLTTDEVFAANYSFLYREVRAVRVGNCGLGCGRGMKCIAQQSAECRMPPKHHSSHHTRGGPPILPSSPMLLLFFILLHSLSFPTLPLSLPEHLLSLLSLLTPPCSTATTGTTMSRSSWLRSAPSRQSCSSSPSRVPPPPSCS